MASKKSEKSAKSAKKAPPKEKQIVSKTELIDRVAKSVDGIAKKDVAAVINHLLPTIVDAVSQGDEVRLIGFGTFKTAHRNARTGRNPQTQEIMEIPASDSFSFRSNIRF